MVRFSFIMYLHLSIPDVSTKLLFYSKENLESLNDNKLIYGIISTI